MRITQPGNRGETLYAYDLDGHLLEQRTKTESTDWATTYGYDAVGRPTRVDYQDGSFTTTTWNPDSTVATQRTRDGLTLSYTYDAANRPLTVVPSSPLPSTLEPLDGGDATSWRAWPAIEPLVLILVVWILMTPFLKDRSISLHWLVNHLLPNSGLPASLAAFIFGFRVFAAKVSSSAIADEDEPSSLW